MSTKRPYIFYIVSYTRSNGIRAMMLLADKLAADGFTVHYYVKSLIGWDDSQHPHLSKISDQLKNEAVVVYPEIQPGNPLRVKNVARMVLFYPGKNGGTHKYHKSEMLFAFRPEYLPGADVLTVPWIDHSIFNDPHYPRTQDCTFVYKGGKWRKIPELDNLTEITMHWPETRLELAELLKRTKTLYSYDNASAVLDEAQACGAHVKIITKDGFTNYAMNYQAVIDDYGTQYKNFVKKTQEANYNGRIQTKYLFLYWTYAVWRYWIKPLFFGRPQPPPPNTKPIALHTDEN